MFKFNTNHISQVFFLAFIYYIILFPLMLFFYLGCDSGSGVCYQIYMFSALLGYTFLYLAVPYVILLCIPFCRKMQTGLFLGSGVAAFLTISVLAIDAIILSKFGYHINGLVINLLFTRGGFESMGLDAATIFPVVIAFLLLLALFVGLGWLAARSKHFAFLAERAFSRIPPRIEFVAFPIVAIILAMTMVGIADFYRNKNMLCALEAYPGRTVSE